MHVDTQLEAALRALDHWPRFRLRLFFEGIVVGILSGTVISFFRWGLEMGTVWRQWIYANVLASGGVLLNLSWFGVLLAAALLLWHLGIYEPNAGGSGIPQVKGVILGAIRMRWLRILWVKLIGGIVGIGMGLSVLVILTCCNVVISLIRKVIPNDIRLAIFVLVIAGFVTIVDLLLQAYVPALSASLGVFIPLIVVNCIILGRAEAFASKNSVAASAVDGICQGIGYTVVLLILSAFRELLGAGTLLGIQIMPSSYVPAGMLTLPVGGFLCLGTLIAIMQWALARSEKKKAKANETEGK